MFVWDRMKCLQFRYSESHILLHCTVFISIDAMSVYFKNELGRGASILDIYIDIYRVISHIITSKIHSIQMISHTNVHTKL